VSKVCNRLEISRAAFYKQMKKEMHQTLADPVIHGLVGAKRKDMPRLGGKKLYTLVKGSMQDHRIAMGRDKFFKWLREHDLLVHPKRRFVKTTNSYHRFRIHKNLIKGMVFTQPDQCWVSDITYLRLQKDHCYLALITDAYSRKIIGYDISQSLELKGCLRALKMACRGKQLVNTIHHSDRGIQYCSNQYTGLLRTNQIQISMAETGNCYENALAERMNGILKSEFNLDAIFENLDQAVKATKQAIDTYNTKRPHMALNMKIPDELYAA